MKKPIKIAENKKGTFKAQAKKMGMGVQEAASKILNAPEGKYSPAMRRKANFAKNAAKWKKEEGGEISIQDIMPYNYYSMADAQQSFPEGGQVQPIYVIDPNDPRLKAYQDSLYWHNVGEEDYKVFLSLKNKVDDAIKNKKTLSKYIITNRNPIDAGYDFNLVNRVNTGNYLEHTNFSNKPNLSQEHKKIEFINPSIEEKNSIIDFLLRRKPSYSAITFAGDQSYQRYKKPTTPIIYRPQNKSQLSTNQINRPAVVQPIRTKEKITTLTPIETKVQNSSPLSVELRPAQPLNAEERNYTIALPNNPMSKPPTLMRFRTREEMENAIADFKNARVYPASQTQGNNYGSARYTVPLEYIMSELEKKEYGGYAEDGYTVRRTSERKGKTHVVTGPDGTKKYFGDPSMGERSKSKYGKEAFYARHKKNLADNPYFRAYAKATWEDGGFVDNVDYEDNLYETLAMMYGGVAEKYKASQGYPYGNQQDQMYNPYDDQGNVLYPNNFANLGDGSKDTTPLAGENSSVAGNSSSSSNPFIPKTKAPGKKPIKNLRELEAQGKVAEGTTAQTIAGGVSAGFDALSGTMQAFAKPDSKFGKAMEKGNAFAEAAKPLQSLDMVVPGLGTGLVQGARLAGAITGGIQAKNEEVQTERIEDTTAFLDRYNNMNLDQMNQGNYISRYGSNIGTYGNMQPMKYAEGGEIVKVRMPNGQVVEMNTASPEYRDTYQKGKLLGYDEKSNTYIAPSLEEVEIVGTPSYNRRMEATMVPSFTNWRRLQPEITRDVQPQVINSEGSPQTVANYIRQQKALGKTGGLFVDKATNTAYYTNDLQNWNGDLSSLQSSRTLVGKNPSPDAWRLENRHPPDWRAFNLLGKQQAPVESSRYTPVTRSSVRLSSYGPEKSPSLFLPETQQKGSGIGIHRPASAERAAALNNPNVSGFQTWGCVNPDDCFRQDIYNLLKQQPAEKRDSAYIIDSRFGVEDNFNMQEQNLDFMKPNRGGLPAISSFFNRGSSQPPFRFEKGGTSNQTKSSQVDMLVDEILMDFDNWMSGGGNSGKKSVASEGTNINTNNQEQIYQGVVDELEVSEDFTPYKRVASFIEDYKSLDPVAKAKIAQKRSSPLWRKSNEQIEQENKQYDYVAKRLLDTLPKGIGRKKQLEKYDSLTPRERQIIEESKYADKFKKPMAYAANRRLQEISDLPLGQQFSPDVLSETQALMGQSGRLPFTAGTPLEYVNPFTLVSSVSPVADFAQGNYGEAAGKTALSLGLGAIGGGASGNLLPLGGIETNLLSTTAKGVGKGLRTGVDTFHPVGKKLREIEKLGMEQGLSAKEIKKLQMDEVGITSQQREGYFPGVSEIMTEYFSPYGYNDMGKRLLNIPKRMVKGEKNKNFLTKDINEVFYTSSPNPFHVGKISTNRYDAWRLYSGLPQQHNTFRIADTTPLNHPSYKNKNLDELEQFSINSEKALLQDAPNVYDYMRYAIDDDLAVKELSQLKEQLGYLRELQNKPVDFRESDFMTTNIMGGYNRRFLQDKLEYNDIWDLQKGKIKVDDYFGKPFLSHGQIDYNLPKVMSNLERIIRKTERLPENIRVPKLDFDQDFSISGAGLKYNPLDFKMTKLQQLKTKFNNKKNGGTVTQQDILDDFDIYLGQLNLKKRYK